MNFEAFGLAGIMAVIYAAKGWLLATWHQVASLVIVQVTIENLLLRRAIEDYCFTHMKPSPLGRRTYEAMFPAYANQSKLASLVALEVLGSDVRLFWLGWVPVWISGGSGGDAGIKSNGASGGGGANLSLIFFRYTISLHELIQKSIALRFDRVGSSGIRRHQIIRRVGHGKLADSMSIRAESPGVSCSRNMNEAWWNSSDMRGRVVGGTIDIFENKQARSIADMWLCPDAEAVLRDFAYWYDSREWFESVGVTWRRNYLLWGRAGCGKSTLVKFLAQKYDLPLFVIEINTMCDRELFNALDDVKMEAPCMVLFEDVDNSFHLREKAAPDLECSFQAWQNVLDGVKAAPGVAMFVTTNKPQCLDSSVAHFEGVIEKDEPIGRVVCTRPGRIDFAAEMLPLTAAGRQQLASRYLPEYTPAEQHVLVEANQDCSAAVFQDVCIQEAVRRQFDRIETKA